MRLMPIFRCLKMGGQCPLKGRSESMNKYENMNRYDKQFNYYKEKHPHEFIPSFEPLRTPSFSR